MIKFRLRESGQIFTLREYQQLHPETTFPENYVPPEADAILASPMPSVPSNYMLVPAYPIQDHLGNWMEAWEVVLKDPSIMLQELNQAKISKNLDINKWRQTANYTSFPFDGKLIACDLLSRSDIEATNAQVTKYNALPAGWPGGWKAIDNSIVIIGTVAKWNQFYDAMYNQGLINFAHSQSLKSILSNANSIEEVNVIVWGL